MTTDEQQYNPLRITVEASHLKKLEDNAAKYHLLHTVCLKHWPAYNDLFHAFIGMETDDADD